LKQLKVLLVWPKEVVEDSAAVGAVALVVAEQHS
tara:strand:- start:177 stop:278 length:102 start_codon:yes stop_codon:yes gene_type:complete